MGHSSVEHRLRADIAKRHSLKNDIGKKESLAARLTRKLERTKKKRLTNRYSATVKRLTVEMDNLKSQLNEMNMDLRKRITDEMEFSEEEIVRFREQYKEELAQVEESESKLKSAEEGAAESDAGEQDDEEPAAKEAMVARTKLILKKERRLLEGLEEEIGSEERDRVLFAKELQGIMVELAEYRESQ